MASFTATGRTLQADPAATGLLVLDGLAKGRQRAIEQAQAQAVVLERAVRLELDRDILAGHLERGRAGRIADALRGRVHFYFRGTVRTELTRAGVRLILQRLFCDCTSLALNGDSPSAESSE